MHGWRLNVVAAKNLSWSGVRHSLTYSELNTFKRKPGRPEHHDETAWSANTAEHHSATSNVVKTKIENTTKI